MTAVRGAIVFGVNSARASMREARRAIQCERLLPVLVRSQCRLHKLVGAIVRMRRL